MDVNAKGDGIARVSSLSSSWQVLRAEIVNAPTFERWPTDAAGEEREQGLMLKIEGVGRDAIVASAGGPSSKEPSKIQGLGISKGAAPQSETQAELWDDEWPGLLDSFDKNMGMLRKIMEAGAEFGGVTRPGTAVEEADRSRLTQVEDHDVGIGVGVGEGQS